MHVEANNEPSKDESPALPLLTTHCFVCLLNHFAAVAQISAVIPGGELAAAGLNSYWPTDVIMGLTGVC